MSFLFFLILSFMFFLISGNSLIGLMYGKVIDGLFC